ncbi:MULTISPECIES: hypothetical protein [Arthrobacter]|uniref:DUF4328 domain-containing protein n=2 Tax=Arthrobacter TaxID=1663 RepID=A0ABU9KPC8_9MICC|nr:hypothetical protein [Arthrobacter sp. YJM1]MDP5227744.1 hypothetical protein [Arthrobacter sp. YJM1]
MSKSANQRIRKHGSKAVVPDTKLPPVVGAPRTAGPTGPFAGRAPRKAEGNATLIVIAAVVAALFLFWYVHLMTLQQMTDLSGGLAMPDSRVFGFGPADVEHLRAAMNTDARGQLQWIHKTAATLFPLIFGLAWLLLIGTRVRRTWLRWTLWAPPVLFALVRLLQNFAVDGLFAASAPSAGAVAWASFLVVSGWVLFVLSLAAALVALTPWGRRRTAV